MPIRIVNTDIIRIECDAIVAPTDRMFSHSGGADAAIHAAAGYDLYRECLKHGPLEEGDVMVSGAYNLPCKHVIHTVGPMWSGNFNEDYNRLFDTYAACLCAARKHGCRSVAFPLISSGVNGFPKDEVMRTALEAISAYIRRYEMTVYVVIYDKNEYELSENVKEEVNYFIEDVFVNDNDVDFLERCECLDLYEKGKVNKVGMSYYDGGDEEYILRKSLFPVNCCVQSMNTDWLIDFSDLDSMLEKLDVGFSELLFYFIDKKRMSDVECYKRANVDKKTFSKIKCNKDYRPSKITAVSFIIALRLSYRQAQTLLATVGMTLSKSSKFDVIITYFLVSGKYRDIHDVNEVLYKYDQPTLGC